MCDQFSISSLLLKIILAEILVTLVFSTLVKTSVGTEEKEIDGKNFEELYAVGTRSYLDNDWNNCIKYLEKRKIFRWLNCYKYAQRSKEWRY